MCKWVYLLVLKKTLVVILYSSELVGDQAGSYMSFDGQYFVYQSVGDLKLTTTGKKTEFKDFELKDWRLNLKTLSNKIKAHLAKGNTSS
jgi:hypothetical protein